MKPFETSVCRWKNNARAALTLSFDGGYRDTCGLAMEALGKYNMPATWFIVTGSVGNELEGRPVATWQELKSAADAGMEIASHSVTHPLLALSPAEAGTRLSRSIIKKGLTVLKPGNITKIRGVAGDYGKQRRGASSTTLIAEAIQSRNTIESEIPAQHVLSFAYPGGRYNSSVKNGIRKAGYLSARATADGYNSPDATERYALKSKVWDVTVNARIAEEWIDLLLDSGAWLIETCHVISRDGTTGYHYDTALPDFEAHLAYISRHDIWVDTQQNIAKYCRARENTRPRLIMLATDRATLVAENRLDPEIYHQALTLKTAVPTTWSSVIIEQPDNVQTVLPVAEAGKHYVYYNIVPNQGEVTLISAVKQI